jgi:hypothetical protein
VSKDLVLFSIVPPQKLLLHGASLCQELQRPACGSRGANVMRLIRKIESSYVAHHAVRLRSFLSTLLSGSCPGVSATFATIAFDNSSLQWLEINT